MENDGTLTQFLADCGTAATNVDRLPLNSLDDINKITDEIGSNRSLNSELSVDVEADGNDEYRNVKTHCPMEQHDTLLSTLSGTSLDTEEPANSQQSESSVYHDALAVLNVEDLILVGSDFSQTMELMLDRGLADQHTTKNNRPVQFRDSEILTTSSQSAVITTASVSEYSSEQHLRSDLTDVVGADKPTVPVNYDNVIQSDTHSEPQVFTNSSPDEDVDADKSPVPVNYDDVIQSDTHSELQVFTSSSPVSSSMTDGNVTHEMDRGTDCVESVDGVHRSSSLVHGDYEAENIATQLVPEDKNSLESENGSVTPVACSMKETLPGENGNIVPANSAITVPDADSSHEHASEANQTVELNCKEIFAEMSERSSSNQDASETDTANSEDMNDYANLSIACEVEVISSTPDGSCKQDVNSVSGSEMTSETICGTSSKGLVSSTGFTVTSHVTETAELESHGDTNNPSSVIILLDSSTSTQPSVVSFSQSVPAVLSNTVQHTASTATSVVTSSADRIHQITKYVITSATEPQSTSTVRYRPAASLVLNIGRNLVTEYVFREIVAHQDKWKSASDAEKVQ